jgi:hypothetical protein
MKRLGESFDGGRETEYCAEQRESSQSLEVVEGEGFANVEVD